MIYKRFVTALAREKVNLDTVPLTAQLVNGYSPDELHKLEDVRPFFVGHEEPVERRYWRGGHLHVGDVEFFGQAVPTLKIDGVVFLANDTMPICHCFLLPGEYDDENAMVGRLKFPDGLVEVLK